MTSRLDTLKRNKDEYHTPKDIFAAVQHLIPADKKVWLPFYGDGKAGKYMEELGFDVYHEKEDFFCVEEHQGDIVCS